MRKPDSPTTGQPSPAGPEPGRDVARRAAIAALLHRLNGGLNNAALAFELASTKSGTDGADSEQVLGRGLAGVEQAARAATLLAIVVDSTTAPPKSAAGPYAQDVVDILRAYARRIGSSAESELDVSSLASKDMTPAAAADALLAGLATLDRAVSRKGP